jgi:hypothetical protein
MNPIVAEIFPYLTKVLANKAEILDYKWIVKVVRDAYGVLFEDAMYKSAYEDIQKAARTTDQDFFTPENYPMPFEKFFFVAEIYEQIPRESGRYEVFQFQRIGGRLTCNLYTLFKQPVGLKARPIITMHCVAFQEDGKFTFEAEHLAGSTHRLDRLHLPFGEELTSLPLLAPVFKNGVAPDGTVTWGEHFSETTYYALVCATYGMFGPVSDTLHYYSTTNPDPIRNAQKIARGNRPKFEWVTSVIEPRTTAPALVLHRGGTHASPKPHERRAHFRRLKSGKSVLVRSTVINKDKMGDRGFVFHDYELSA